MRYIILTSTNYPNGGAAANYLRLLSKGIVEHGGKVDVLLLKGFIYGNQRTEDKRVNFFEGSKYVYCGSINRPFGKVGKLLDSFQSFFYSAFYILKHSKKGTTILNYSNETHLYFLSFLVAKLLRRRFISFVPEGIEDSKKKFSLGGYVSDLSFKASVSFFNRKSSKMVVFSNYLKRYYVSRGYKERDLLVVPNLLDVDIFSGDRGHGNGIFRIGYCGTPSVKDGIKDLLQSFKLVHDKDPNCELLIIGDSVNRNSVLGELEREVGDKVLLSKIIFTGLLPFFEVAGKLHTCDVLVLARPSGLQAEAGFPTKIGEYFACKKPVVVTKVGDIPFYFTDGVHTLLAEPDCPASIAERILWVKQNPKQAVSIGLNGFLWAQKNLDYKKNTGRMLSFFENTSA